MAVILSSDVRRVGTPSSSAGEDALMVVDDGKRVLGKGHDMMKIC